ncbi:hypothetical protein EVAR_3772_1 [Eumeta japonica]|uniref:Uncharacterized protein n=1 Tax=Eumeta variegata TaxID=151549 RepID=A0A4C1SU64_EUMVA|nr:hypothetical protein EVAR_3772_1 [Eumeta japonica]
MRSRGERLCGGEANIVCHAYYQANFGFAPSSCKLELKDGKQNQEWDQDKKTGAGQNCLEPKSKKKQNRNRKRDRVEIDSDRYQR